MENEKTINLMISLAQLDIDAAFAYEEALKNIEDTEIYQQISEFRLDHIRHIDDLDMLINQYGGKPPEREKDLKGHIIEGMTMLRGITGLHGTLKAMQSNEENTNKTYKNAINENPDCPADVMQLLQLNYQDEIRHLQYIKEKLNTLK